MSEKHLRLAAFVAECPEDEPWDEKMRAWNRAYAEPDYHGYNYGPEHGRNFHRDASQACDRLLNPEYQTLWEIEDLTGALVSPEGQQVGETNGDS